MMGAMIKLEYANPESGISRMVQRHVKPRPITTVTEWADKNRKLTTEGSGEPGQWSTSRTPYLAEIMDSLSVTSPVERVVMMFASQIGKTEVGLNWIGYVMDHSPAAMLVVVPTLEVRKKWVLQRLSPMLRETPPLRELFSGSKRDATNSEDIKTFPGGMVVLAGANSPSSLASMPIKYVLCDEVDSYETEFSDEGDALGVISQRTVTFPRRKILLISTPKKDKGESVIEAEYEKTDMREFHVPCPHCGEYQVLRWKHADGVYGVVPRETTGAVYYVCRADGCGAYIEEHHKPDMLARGRWIPRHPERKARGYHLSALYAPIGLGLSWAELFAEWKEAQHDTGKLKSFLQLKLGETWENKKEGADPLSIVARLETYPEQMPRRVRSIGIDVQKGRVEMSVYDFGPGDECWGIDHIIIEGDVAGQEIWDELRDEIANIRPDCGGIDTGYSATECYAFADKVRWMLITKGIEGKDKPFVEDNETRKRRLRKRRKKGHSPFLVSNTAAMALITQRLNLPSPTEGQSRPGYIHFPKGDPAFDDEFFRQLASSAHVEVKRNKRSVFEWKEKATHPRNEAFDCWKLALAAVRLGGFDLEKPLAPKKAAPDGSTPPPAASQKPAARRSNIGKDEWSGRL
jgi:phage terminase large subunit GpA-like protein